jgi:hypothetical protein
MREVAHRRLSNCRASATLHEKREGEWNPEVMEPGEVVTDGPRPPALELVMPGLVPGIHVLQSHSKKDVDGRDKPGHDGKRINFKLIARALKCWLLFRSGS